MEIISATAPNTKGSPEMIKNWPLFWCLESETQAALIQWQWDNYGERLKIPTPPMTSKAVWGVVVEENSEEIDRLIRQAPSRSRGKDGD